MKCKTDALTLHNKRAGKYSWNRKTYAEDRKYLLACMLL